MPRKVNYTTDHRRPIFGNQGWIDLKNVDKRIKAQRERHAELQRKLDTGEIRYNS